MPGSINTRGASAIRWAAILTKSRIWLGVHGLSLAFMRSGGIEKMGGIRGGKFLLLVLGRLEKRLDRLLHRTSRNLEQPVDRSSWRERAARVSISVFWVARDRSRAPSTLRTICTLRIAA